MCSPAQNPQNPAPTPTQQPDGAACDKKLAGLFGGEGAVADTGRTPSTLQHPTAGMQRLPEAHLKLGLAHSSIAVSVNDGGEYSKASLKAFQETVRLKPDWPEALNHLGDRYRALQEYDKSITSLKEAIRLRPEFPDAQENLAITYLYAGHHKEAVVWLTKVITAKPARPRPHKLLGLTYLILEDKKKALEQYSILQSLDQEMAKDLENGSVVPVSHFLAYSTAG